MHSKTIIISIIAILMLTLSACSGKSAYEETQAESPTAVAVQTEDDNSSVKETIPEETTVAVSEEEPEPTEIAETTDDGSGEDDEFWLRDNIDSNLKYIVSLEDFDFGITTSVSEPCHNYITLYTDPLPLIKGTSDCELYVVAERIDDKRYADYFCDEITRDEGARIGVDLNLFEGSEFNLTMYVYNKQNKQVIDLGSFKPEPEEEPKGCFEACDGEIKLMMNPGNDAHATTWITPHESETTDGITYYDYFEVFLSGAGNNIDGFEITICPPNGGQVVKRESFKNLSPSTWLTMHFNLNGCPTGEYALTIGVWEDGFLHSEYYTNSFIYYEE